MLWLCYGHWSWNVECDKLRKTMKIIVHNLHIHTSIYMLHICLLQTFAALSVEILLEYFHILKLFGINYLLNFHFIRFLEICLFACSREEFEVFCVLYFNGIWDEVRMLKFRSEVFRLVGWPTYRLAEQRMEKNFEFFWLVKSENNKPSTLRWSHYHF